MKNNKGFTVVEVVVTVAILAVVSTGFFSLYTAANHMLAGAVQQDQETLSLAGTLEGGSYVGYTLQKGERVSLSITFAGKEKLNMKSEGQMLSALGEKSGSSFTCYLPNEKRG